MRRISLASQISMWLEADPTGFSLVEMTIALAISAGLIALIYNFVGKNLSASGESHHSYQQEKRSDQLSRLIRKDLSDAGFDPRQLEGTRTPFLPIQSATDTSLTLQGDFNMNSAIEPTPVSGDEPETIVLGFDSSAKAITRNGSPVLTGVQNFHITYYVETTGCGLPHCYVAVAAPNTVAQKKAIRRLKFEWSLDLNGGNVQARSVEATLGNVVSP